MKGVKRAIDNCGRKAFQKNLSVGILELYKCVCKLPQGKLIVDVCLFNRGETFIKQSRKNDWRAV